MVKKLCFNGVEYINLGSISSVTKLAGFEFSEYVTYSETGSIIALRGLNVKNGKLNLDNVKYVDKSDFSKLERSKLFKGDILFTYVGTIGEVAIIDENDKYYLAPNVAKISVDRLIVLPEYMKYLFQSTNFKKKQIERWLEFSSMKNLTMENIRKFLIPLPPLPLQQKIVSILDSLDEMCNSLTSGLPREIELSRKRYEYYRNKLLNFGD